MTKQQWRAAPASPGNTHAYTLWILLSFLLLNGCATLTPSFETPSVSVTSLRLLPSTGLEQSFEVGLQVTNPNSRALKLKGMSYSLTIDDYKLASGVTADIPEIAGYGSARVTVPVTASLMNSLRLVQSLVSTKREQLSYRLEASLDTGIRLMPRIKVVEEGALPLGPNGT